MSQRPGPVHEAWARGPSARGSRPQILPQRAHCAPHV